ncbi:hypothetical protein O9K51_02251 [Purpureocillium lavendulum]|uniref:Uncharacterized protein n=1 Tax=Purpureocillium lavendulum TaxID=1247861 RepID=A0AB34FWT0_9HYPO|nr:hypothetical protein O9K51_02251 [Purpureocillium lavendulum]
MTTKETESTAGQGVTTLHLSNSPEERRQYVLISSFKSTSTNQTIIMSGNSKVGTSAVYEAGDQRNVKQSEQNTATPYEEGKVNSHKLTDPNEFRATGGTTNTVQRQGETPDDKETAMGKKDPTLPAKMHGNEPSKGAKIDAQLQAEDEQRLREKQGK